MPHIVLDEVSLIYPVLGAGPRGRVGSDELDGAGSFIRDRSSRGRGVVALSNVSLRINEGDRVGLIGRNGSGKSTLLQTIAGIYEPSEGSVEVSGSVAGLYSVGLGMRPEASGYRNIELSGLLAGYSKKEIAEMLPSIAAFTELGDYLSMPVRTYSNGMAMRLKFACGTAFNPEILLMDEWLGAGDPEFQKKAQRRMSMLVESAGILLLASHSHSLITRTCSKAAWLDRGILKAYGPSEEVVACAEGRMSPEEMTQDDAQDLSFVTSLKSALA